MLPLVPAGNPAAPPPRPPLSLGGHFMLNVLQLKVCSNPVPCFQFSLALDDCTMCEVGLVQFSLPGLQLLLVHLGENQESCHAASLCAQIKVFLVV